MTASTACPKFSASCTVTSVRICQRGHQYNEKQRLTVNHDGTSKVVCPTFYLSSRPGCNAKQKYVNDKKQERPVTFPCVCLCLEKVLQSQRGGESLVELRRCKNIWSFCHVSSNAPLALLRHKNTQIFEDSGTPATSVSSYYTSETDLEDTQLFAVSTHFSSLR